MPQRCKRLGMMNFDTANLARGLLIDIGISCSGALHDMCTNSRRITVQLVLTATITAFFRADSK